MQGLFVTHHNIFLKAECLVHPNMQEEKDIQQTFYLDVISLQKGYATIQTLVQVFDP